MIKEVASSTLFNSIGFLCELMLLDMSYVCKFKFMLLDTSYVCKFKFMLLDMSYVCKFSMGYIGSLVQLKQL